jgi:hypothetical protein
MTCGSGSSQRQQRLQWLLHHANLQGIRLQQRHVPRLRPVELVTFGLWKDLKLQTSRGPCVKSSDALILRTLRAVAGEQIDMIVDTRVFKDPEAGELRDHCGLHATIIERVVFNDKFPAFLQRVRMQVVPALMSNSVPFRLGIFCRSGKHRSVAVAQILRHVFAACMPGHNVTWRCVKKHSRCLNGYCAECNERPQSFMQAMAHASSVWLDEAHAWRSA